jgi:biopolymer transport protein ExbB
MKSLSFALLMALVTSLSAEAPPSLDTPEEILLVEEVIPLESEFELEAAPLFALVEEEEEPLITEAPAMVSVQEPALIGEPTRGTPSGISIDLTQAFRGSPLIYSVLIGMSVFSLCLWLYSLTSLRLATRSSPSAMREIQDLLSSNQFQDAHALCGRQNTLLGKMISSAIQARSYGLPLVIESMKAEAKRSTVFFWQKLGLLNDIAIIAPMLGLLGTVLGMFYAFYDVNRSIESISALFDGLGISVGTTVAGLLVAILALILHSSAKYRLVRALAHVENQAQSLVPLLDDKTSIHERR